MATTTTTAIPKPPYDSELEPILKSMGLAPNLTKDNIPYVRVASAPTLELTLQNRNIIHEERVIDGFSSPITISIFHPKDSSPNAQTEKKKPVFLYTHGGGMIAGNRFMGVDAVLDWVEKFSAVCVSVEYHLAPEYPAPIPVEDCYSALLWIWNHSEEIGVDRGKIVVVGTSAGGGIAAGSVLAARDRGVVNVGGQVLICPMLDDRSVSNSSFQFIDEGTWSRGSNLLGWECLLGPNHLQDRSIRVYDVPGRNENWEGLPSTFIDVGSAEVFRDEAIAYAAGLWKDGVQAELHVWAGGFHGFDLLVPEAEISRVGREARERWVGRLLRDL